MKKIIISMIVALAFLISAGAANVTIDGESFNSAKLIGSVTYVPVRSFGEVLSDGLVSWDSASRTAVISFSGKEASAE